MAKLKQPALMRVAGGVLATAVVGLGITALGLAPAQADTDAPAPVTHTYTNPAGDSFTIPAGVSSITAVAQGGSGGSGPNRGVVGGIGAAVQATFPVTPGDTLAIYGAADGGKVGSTFSPGAGGAGWINGGSGGSGSRGSVSLSGGGGGGAAAVLLNGQAVVIAAGGGAAGGFGGGEGGCRGGNGASGSLAGQAGSSGAGDCLGKGAAGVAQSSGINGGSAGNFKIAGGGGGAGAGTPTAGGGGAGGTGGGGGGGGGAGGSFYNTEIATHSNVIPGMAANAGQVILSYTIDTTTMVVANQGSAHAGAPVTYTIVTAIADTTTMVGGNVTLYAGECGTGTVLGSGALNSGSLAMLAGAAADVCATFDATGPYNSSMGRAQVEIIPEVTQAPTETSVEAGSFMYGQSYPARITVSAPEVGAASARQAGATPTGEVEVTVGDGATQTFELDENGSVEVPRDGLDAGDYVIRANYLGNDSFQKSDNSSEFYVEQWQTAVSVSLAPVTSELGDDVTAQAAVTLSSPETRVAENRANDVPVATGEVEFFVGTTSVGKATLVNGVADLPLENLPVGDFVVTASFLGSTNFALAEGLPAYGVVNQAPTTTIVTATSSTGVVGDEVALVADVAGARDGFVLGGTVQFTVNGNPLGDPISVSNGKASLNVSDLALGTSTIVANYSGDINYVLSGSKSIEVLLKEAGSEIPWTPIETAKPVVPLTPIETAKPIETTKPVVPLTPIETAKPVTNDQTKAPTTAPVTESAKSSATASSTSSTKVLANTGANGGGLAVGALTLLGLGVALVAAQRRRTSAKH